LRKQLAAIEGMDAKIGLRNMRDDAVVYLRLLRQFDSSHADDMSKLSGHFAESDADQVRIIAHTLKGAAGTLGLIRLQEAAKVLEQKLPSHTGDGSNDQVSELIAAVYAEQDNLHQALANIAGQLLPERAIKADPAAAQKILDRLGALLETDDSTVNALFLESEALLKSTFGPTVDQLGQQVEAFDYPAALKTIASISISESRDNLLR